MKNWLASMSVLLGFAAALSAALQADEAGDGDSSTVTVLFDGTSLDDWEHIGPGTFVLEDGLLKTEGGMGLLWFKKHKFGDCVLRVVFKTTRQEDNSGVYVRIAKPPEDPWYAVHHGYEVQIADKPRPGRRCRRCRSTSGRADPSARSERQPRPRLGRGRRHGPALPPVAAGKTGTGRLVCGWNRRFLGGHFEHRRKFLRGRPPGNRG